MGLLNTVIKKSDATLGVNNSNLSSNDEKKILLNINARIEDLKVQNFENAKFLRGISRKIETELNQMREVEENKSVELYDDTHLLESIGRVEKSLQEINNNEVLAAIERVNTSLADITSSEVLESIDKINQSMSEINSNELSEEMKRINESVKSINFNEVLYEIHKLN
ncbi:MAG: hypothetical protein K2N34_16405, partial [Lachnospiraceae bacterium]|nr:hypothetical protein [Lachnospiraceae bacterium]